MELRPYQLRDYKNIVNSFKTNNKVLYQCPTGGGKSIVIAQFIEDNKNKKILFLSHKREIITQMYNRLKSLNIPSGFIMAQTEIDLDSNILIGSISTLTRDKRIESILSKSYDIIVIDEAHRTPTKSYVKVLEHLYNLNKNTLLFGVTATPHRTDKKILSNFYNDLILSDDISTLIKDGYLSDYKTHSTKIKDIADEVISNSDDYQITSLSKFMRKPEYITYLVDSYKKLGENKQMIVFCVDKSHAKDVAKAYKDAGYSKLAYLDSDTSQTERDDIIVKYGNGEIQIIVCIETLTEGVDLPETGVIQLARPTKSLTLYLQMLGRGLRPKENKEPLIILDNSGNTQEHGVVSAEREWSLNNNINPSHKRTKNKIVGKRADGTYTDDLDEMDYLELEELTPDEYIEKMGMDVNKAKEYNDDLKKKVHLLVDKLVDLFKKNKNINRVQYEKYYDDPERLNISFMNGNIIDFNFKDKNISGFYSLKLDNAIQLGELSTFINKNMKFIDSINNEIKEIHESKINIGDIHTKLDQINTNKTKHFIEKQVNEKLPLLLNTTLSTYSINSRGYRYEKFNKIVFENTKFNKTQNKINIFNDEQFVGSYTLSMDKILDIVKNKIKYV